MDDGPHEHTSSTASTHTRIHPGVVFISGFVCALILSVLWTATTADNSTEQTEKSRTEQRESSEGFKYVSPLLLCGIETKQQTTKVIEDIRDEVAGILDAEQDAGKVTDAGVYFRELNDGTWFGLGERVQFTPGSLLKVPLAISLMKKRSEDSSFMQTPITYDGSIPTTEQKYPPAEHAEPGKTYTFEELIRLSLVYSDNTATQILGQILDRPTLDAAYSDLGIDTPTTGDAYTMTVRTYASFFRILYNGTYASPRDSEYLLSLLAQSTFKDGIVAGVPADVVVAHKFGERSRSPGMTEQLHDCGIVYHWDHPYILCVMLRGPDIKGLAPVIARISRAVYEGVAREE